MAPALLGAQDTGRAPVPPVDTTAVAVRDTITRSVGVLRSGDALKIAVWREKELNGEYLIDARGIVQIPGLGDIMVAGLTPPQVKDRLSEQLVQRGIESPEISVQPVIRVSVLGEVRTPGLQSVEPGTNLIHLITLAGGPTERANMREVRVIRNGVPYEVDLQSALAGSPAGLVVLYSNDVVFLDRKRGLTRENLSFGMNVLTALLSVVSVITVLQNR
ncbi:MAG: polysaccharide biosynthesis/export family protein [Gemmatimonadaceae bacterium]